MLKKEFLALAAFLMLTISAQAQEVPQIETNPSDLEKRVERVDKLAANLGLDEPTTATFKEIYAGMEAKTKEIRNQDIDRREKRAQLKTLREETDEQMKEILTEEQFAKYEEMRKKRRQRQRDRRQKKREENQ
ncbi:MAG: hypothetical protein MK226_18845 [Saprospiraceae bacterium]|nr:hypothetical protein [Saprospiraceae bacterium]